MQGYHTPGKTDVLICFANPYDIISFQDEGAAIRWDRFFPYGVTTEDIQTKGMYFQSDYAKKSAERIREDIKKVVEETKKLKEFEDEIVNELTVLTDGE